MSGKHTPQEPVAYSYNTTYKGEVTGHTVTIAPHQLDSSIKNFKDKTAGQGPTELTATLTAAMLSEGDFGTIPDSAAIAGELQAFINGHARVMESMGGVLDDFVARVQAAAQLGYQTDPETRRELAWAKIHEAY